ncbi:GIP [Symbiodinium sp. CCMP2456]|nr:GIP [Symbiodinium sp. CCMP2456]
MGQAHREFPLLYGPAGQSDAGSERSSRRQAEAQGQLEEYIQKYQEQVLSLQQKVVQLKLEGDGALGGQEVPQGDLRQLPTGNPQPQQQPRWHLRAESTVCVGKKYPKVISLSYQQEILSLSSNHEGIPEPFTNSTASYFKVISISYQQEICSLSSNNVGIHRPSGAPQQAEEFQGDFRQLPAGNPQPQQQPRGDRFYDVGQSNPGARETMTTGAEQGSLPHGPTATTGGDAPPTSTSTAKQWLGSGPPADPLAMLAGGMAQLQAAMLKQLNTETTGERSPETAEPGTTTLPFLPEPKPDASPVDIMGWLELIATLLSDLSDGAAAWWKADEVYSDEEEDEEILKNLEEKQVKKNLGTCKASALKEFQFLACGNHVPEDESTCDLFAAGLDATSLRTMLAFNNNKKHWRWGVADIRQAFVLAKWLGGQVALQPPAIAYELGLAEEGDMWLVRQALYGLRESPAMWSQYRAAQLAEARWTVMVEDAPVTMRLEQLVSDNQELEMAQEGCVKELLRCPELVNQIGRRLLDYPCETAHFRLSFVYKEEKEGQLDVYTDSSFAPSGGRSNGCCPIFYGDAAIAWRAGRQALCSLSTAESELLEAVEGAVLGRSTKSLLEELQGKPIVMNLLVDIQAVQRVGHGEHVTYVYEAIGYAYASSSTKGGQPQEDIRAEIPWDLYFVVVVRAIAIIGLWEGAKSCLKMRRTRNKALRATANKSLDKNPDKKPEQNSKNYNGYWHLLLKIYPMIKSYEWNLSHTETVELPKELDSRDDAKLPARWQVLFLRDVFNYCKSEGSFQLTFSDLEYGLRRSLTPDLWDLVSDAMRKMTDEIRGPATFFHFLKKAYPGCQPKHLATFQDWCNQYDELQRRSAEMDLLTEAAALFEKKNAMPILPVDDQARLEKEFEEMDMFGTGCVEVAAIQRRWDWDEQMTRDIIAKYDLSEDGCLDKGDFLRMMCPDGFRLPSMQGSDRDVFGMLLTGSIRYLEDAISTEEGLYAEDVKAAKEVRLKPMPFSLLPEIPEATWIFWNDLFTRLDADEDDHIRERDLLREGLLSPEVVESAVFAKCE